MRRQTQGVLHYQTWSQCASCGRAFKLGTAACPKCEPLADAASERATRATVYVTIAIAVAVFVIGAASVLLSGCGSSEPWTEAECLSYIRACTHERGFGTQVECTCEVESECPMMFGHERGQLYPNTCETL